MKPIILLTVLLITGCGRHEHPGIIMREILGVGEAHRRIDDIRDKSKQNTKDIEELKLQVANLYEELNDTSLEINSLEALLQSNELANQNTIAVLNQMIVELQQDLEALDSSNQSEIDAINVKINDLEDSIDHMNTDAGNSESIIIQLISDLENDVILNEIRLAELESNENITDIIDPCGDKPNAFDEVILKTSSGKLMAYFEQGTKRFLSLLVDGSYQTTDAQACSFSVVNGEVI